MGPTAHDLEGLVDEPWRARLSGLSGDEVTVRMSVDSLGVRYERCRTLPVVDGGCDLPSDLITAAARTADPGTPPEAPWDPLRCTLSAPGLEVAFSREFRSPDVDVEELSGPLFGRLYLPPGAGPHPVVMLLSGSGGGTNDREAALLASRGYACLALAYFNYPGRPDGLVEIALEYFDEAYTWLDRHPRTDAARVVLKGGSRGGELVAQLASVFDWPAAVVPVVPGAHRWGGVSPDGAPAVGWTWKGEPLPFVPSDGSDEQAAVERDGAIVYVPVFDHALERASADVVSRARIEVEQITCPALFITGREDAMWRGSDFADEMLAALEAAHPGIEHRHLALPDAGHMITPPGQPVELVLVHPVVPLRLALGGTVDGTARGREQAWRCLLDFLGRTVGEQLT